MKIIEILKSDKEIQELNTYLSKTIGCKLLYNYDCYSGIEDYKNHLRECVQQGKITERPQDKIARHRFDSIIKKS